MTNIEPFRDEEMPGRFLFWLEQLRQKVNSLPTAEILGLGLWRYRTLTTSTPAARDLHLDNLTIASATNLYLNVGNDAGTDMSAFLALLASGDVLYIQMQDDASRHIVIEIGVPALSAGVYTFPITTIITQGGDSAKDRSKVAVVRG